MSKSCTNLGIDEYKVVEPDFLGQKLYIRDIEYAEANERREAKTITNKV